jgi:hypothetical protein
MKADYSQVHIARSLGPETRIRLHTGSTLSVYSSFGERDSTLIFSTDVTAPYSIELPMHSISLSAMSVTKAGVEEGCNQCSNIRVFVIVAITP